MPGKLASPNEPFDIGAYHFEPIGEIGVEGRTIEEVESAGPAQVIRVTGPEGVELDVADLHWRNGEREVRVVGRGSSHQKYDHLVKRRRIGIKSHLVSGRPGAVYMELRQARWVSDERSSKYMATIQELSEGAGVDVRDALTDAGAIEVGTCESVLDHHDQNKNYLCALFDKSNSRLPIVAYVLTRIAPLVRGVTA